MRFRNIVDPSEERFGLTIIKKQRPLKVSEDAECPQGPEAFPEACVKASRRPLRRIRQSCLDKGDLLPIEGPAQTASNPAWMRAKFVLPKPEHTPPFAPQLRADPLVSRAVPSNLSRPIGLVRCWRPVAFWTSMPEAAVHKHNHPLKTEREVRLPSERLTPPPAGNRVLLHDLDQAEFGLRVSV